MSVTELEKIAEETAGEKELDLSDYSMDYSPFNKRYVRQTEKKDDFFMQYSRDVRKGNCGMEYFLIEQVTLSDSSYLLVASIEQRKRDYTIDITPKKIFHGVNIARSHCSHGQDFDSCKSIKLMLPKNVEGHTALKKLIKHIFS